MRLIVEVKSGKGDRMPEHEPAVQDLVDRMPDDLMPAFEAWNRDHTLGLHSELGASFHEHGQSLTDLAKMVSGDQDAFVTLRKRRGRPFVNRTPKELRQASRERLKRYAAKKREEGVESRRVFLAPEVSERLDEVVSQYNLKGISHFIKIALIPYGHPTIRADSDAEALRIVAATPSKVPRSVVGLPDGSYVIRRMGGSDPIQRLGPGERNVGIVEPKGGTND